MVGRDLHNCAERQLRIKGGDIGGFHSNTTVAGRPGDRCLLRRAVNVGAPVISMRVSSFQTAESDNAGDDGVAPWRIRLQNFAGETAVVKNSADRSMITDFLSNLESAERCGHRTPSIADSEFRGRDGINRGIAAVVEEHQVWIEEANDHVWLDQLCEQLSRARGH